MKRELELVKKILIAGNESFYTIKNSLLENHDLHEIGHHVYLMWKAGLVDAEDISTLHNDYKLAMLTGVTWEGHEFMKHSENATIWKKAVGKFENESGAFALESVKIWIRQQIDMP